MNGYFVTGTDTDVGKTYVASALVRRARSLGHSVFAFKPIETGCVTGPSGARLGADQELLAVAAGDWQQGALRGVYRLALPAAPLVAAEREGTTIDLASVVAVAQQGAIEARASLTVVEGAGGWRVPITAREDMSTLARGLGLPVLIVARGRLGTINHTLLTIEAVERDGLVVGAVVLSCRPEDDAVAAASNRAEIHRRWPGSVIALGADPTVLDGLIPRRDEV